MLNQQIEKTLNKKLGLPSRSVKKVSAWSLNSNADLVLETNYETVNPGLKANVWVPVEYKSRLSEFNIVDYQEGKGRHSNTYPSKGLERDKGALKIVLSSQSEAELMLSKIL